MTLRGERAVKLVDSVHFEKEVYPDFVLIRSTGLRESFMDSVNASSAFLELIRSTGSNYILADYRGVEYHLGNSDLFSVTRHIETKLPEMMDLTMAFVIDESSAEIARFWVDIFLRRGFRMRAFFNPREARDWLIREKNRNKG
jgi:hypothetical protein